jgi:N-acetylglucosaminyl-diphospho-decaprenol L-rhamnosyltransferase
MPSPAELRLGVVLYQNTKEQLARLVRSLGLCRESKRSPTFRVAWVDHSEAQGLGQTLAELGEHDYRLGAGNAGFGAGHNRLMREAFAEPTVGAYVCVNPDAVLHPDCLAELADEWRRQGRPGLVEARQFPDEHPKIYDALSHRTPWCAGCVLLITRPLFEAIGGFDEAIFLYCEDVDLSWRARGAGFGTYLAPRALVHHYADGRVPEKDPRAQMLASGAYLGRKYGDRQFQARCEREYRALRGGAIVVPEPAAVDEGAVALSDFSHGFSFTEARW